MQECRRSWWAVAGVCVLAGGCGGEPEPAGRLSRPVLGEESLVVDPGEYVTWGTAWGDFDADGRLDLVLTRALASDDGEAPDVVYRGTSRGLEWCSVLGGEGEDADSRAVAWGDWDGDGLLDLAVGGFRTDVIWRNLGGDFDCATPRFEKAWESEDHGVETMSLAWSDYDLDGDLDLAVGLECCDAPDGGPARDLLYSFEDGQADTIPLGGRYVNTVQVRWARIGGNRYPDLLTMSEGSFTRYPNSAGLVGAEVPVALIELGGAIEGNLSGFALGQNNLADDSDLDLYLTGVNGGRRYLWQAGSEGWAGEILPVESGNPAPLPATSLDLGDHDGDGELDVLFGGSTWVDDVEAPDSLYIAQGGRYERVWTSAEALQTWAVAWGDVDQDGDLDAALARSIGGGDVLRSPGATLLGRATGEVAGEVTDIAWGDVDGDGDLERALLTSTQVIVRLDDPPLLGTEGGSDIVGPGGLTVAWADWDDDGDLDLIVGGADGVRFYEVDVVGGRLDEVLALSAVGTGTVDMAWGDVDRDARLDFVAARGDGVWLYRGTRGGFGDPRSVAPGTGTAVDLADADQDGFLDLAAATGPDTVRVLRFDPASGAFVEVWSGTGFGEVGGLAWGDLDGDSHPDLAIAAPGGDTEVRLNARLDFGALGAELDTASNAAVAWADYDTDGDLDLSTAGRLWRNDGGLLVLGEAWDEAAGAVVAAEWGDHDADGDVELLIGGDEGSTLRHNERTPLPLLPENPTHVFVPSPTGVPAARGSHGRALQGAIVEVAYVVRDADGDPAPRVTLEFSTDDGST